MRPPAITTARNKMMGDRCFKIFNFPPPGREELSVNPVTGCRFFAKLVRTLDDLQGNGREVIAGNVLQGDKTGIQGIGIPFEVTLSITAEEINKDIVVSDSSVRITENAIENFHQIEDFHL
jgi:hypothetical protein